LFYQAHGTGGTQSVVKPADRGYIWYERQ